MREMCFSSALVGPEACGEGSALLGPLPGRRRVAALFGGACTDAALAGTLLAAEEAECVEESAVKASLWPPGGGVAAAWANDLAAIIA